MKDTGSFKFNWNQIMRMSLKVTESAFMAGMRERAGEVGSKSMMGMRDCALLYSLTRWRKPRTVVESGGFLGMSTSFILKALADEGVEDACVYSVERKLDREHGELIPDDLRDGFVPMSGKIEHFMKQQRFPDQVDMFLHDSSHRYRHMMMELSLFLEAHEGWRLAGLPRRQPKRRFHGFCVENLSP